MSDFERLGKEAHTFFNSPVGNYLTECVERDLEMARDELEKCDPTNFWGRRKWKRVKMRMESIRRVNSYLVDLVMEYTNHLQESENDGETEHA